MNLVETVRNIWAIEDLRRRVLFITSSYPEPDFAALGIFVKEHARAVARHAEVAVLHLDRSERVKRIHFDDRGLTRHQVRAIALVDLCSYFHEPGFDHVHNRPSGRYLIAGAILGM